MGELALAGLLLELKCCYLAVLQCTSGHRPACDPLLMRTLQRVLSIPLPLLFAGSSYLFSTLPCSSVSSLLTSLPAAKQGPVLVVGPSPVPPCSQGTPGSCHLPIPIPTGHGAKCCQVLSTLQPHKDVGSQPGTAPAISQSSPIIPVTHTPDNYLFD